MTYYWPKVYYGSAFKHYVLRCWTPKINLYFCRFGCDPIYLKCYCQVAIKNIVRKAMHCLFSINVWKYSKFDHCFEATGSTIKGNLIIFSFCCFFIRIRCIKLWRADLWNLCRSHQLTVFGFWSKWGNNFWCRSLRFTCCSWKFIDSRLLLFDWHAFWFPNYLLPNST